MFAPSVRAKLAFFDRAILRRNWRAINETPVKKAGLLVRKIARQSIRRGRITRTGHKRPSSPGTPPKSWGKGATPPFKMIYSVPDNLGLTAVVGMVGFGGVSVPVPGRHEHGATASTTIVLRTGGRKGRIRRTWYGKPKVKTKKMARYPKRPFMLPALMKAKPRLPTLWSGSLGRGV